MAETFSATPLYSWEARSSANVLITEFESGKEQRRYKGPQPREWTLGFRAAVATIDAIVSFWEAREGPYEAFSWTPPGAATAISVRFKENSLSVRYSGAQYAECELTLREIL